MEHWSKFQWLCLLGIILAYYKFLRLVFQDRKAQRAEPKPFATREEFLKARVEMDLGEFLDRCDVTPDALKVTLIKAVKPVDLDVVDLNKVVERAGGAIRASWAHDGSGVVRTGVGGAGTVGGNLGYPSSAIGVGFPSIIGSGGSGGLYGNVVQARVPLVPGCWYRRKSTGELLVLMRTTRDDGVVGSFLGKTGNTFIYHDEVDLAAPRAGEAWMFKVCQAHVAARGSFEVYVATPHSSGFYEELTRCGCHVPANFGFGKI